MTTLEHLKSEADKARIELIMVGITTKSITISDPSSLFLDHDKFIDIVGEITQEDLDRQEGTALGKLYKARNEAFFASKIYVLACQDKTQEAMMLKLVKS